MGKKKEHHDLEQNMHILSGMKALLSFHQIAAMFHLLKNYSLTHGIYHNVKVISNDTLLPFEKHHFMCLRGQVKLFFQNWRGSGAAFMK